MKMRAKSDEPMAFLGSMRVEDQQLDADRPPAGAGNARREAGGQADAADPRVRARRSSARTLPRPLKLSVARTMTPTNTIIAATTRAITSLGRAAAKNGPMNAPIMPPMTSGRATFREKLPIL